MGTRERYLGMAMRVKWRTKEEDAINCHERLFLCDEGMLRGEKRLKMWSWDGARKNEILKVD